MALLTIAQAAEHLAVSARSVEREIAAGKLAVVTIRGRVRIDPAELQAYILRQQTRRNTSCQHSSEVTLEITGFDRPAGQSPVD